MPRLRNSIPFLPQAMYKNGGEAVSPLDLFETCRLNVAPRPSDT